MDFGILVDVAIGVCAVLILFSIAASAVNEFIADTLMQLRGKSLVQALETLLERELEKSGGKATAAELVEKFYADPDIRVLMNGKRRPSAIEARRYALTMLKLLAERGPLAGALTQRIEAARKEAVHSVQTTFRALGREEEGSMIAAKLGVGAEILKRIPTESVKTLDAMVTRLEAEFDEVMDRASGWYLRRTKLNLLAIGFVLAVGSNIDILSYADRMITADDVTGKIDTIARLVGSKELEDRVKASDVVGGQPAAVAMGPLVSEEKLAMLNSDLDYAVAQLAVLDVKIGWDCRADAPGRFNDLVVPFYCEAGQSLPVPSPSQIFGWVLIAFGVTFGAQMWFDLVRRLVRLRTAGITGGVASRPDG